MSAPFRVGFVTGVTPDKWARTWRDRRRDPLELLPVEQDEHGARLAERPNPLVDAVATRDDAGAVLFVVNRSLDAPVQLTVDTRPLGAHFLNFTYNP